MARRNDHTKDELKNIILDTAINIIKKEGFQKLTARRLAKDIGYTPGTIYNIYDSMDGLYFAIKAFTLEKLFETISTPHKSTKITENIKNMTKSYMDFTHNNKELWLMLFSAPLSHNSQPPEWYKKLVTKQFEPLEDLLEPLNFNSPENKIQAARAIWSTVHGISLMKETEKMALISDQDALQIAEYMIDHFIAGITLSKT